MQTNSFKLYENINVGGPVVDSHYNVYVTKKSVFFISLDNGFKEKLLRISVMVVFGLSGYLLFGFIVGSLVAFGLYASIVNIIMNKIRNTRIEELRYVGIDDLYNLDGFGCDKKDVKFEEGYKYTKVHLGVTTSFDVDKQIAEKIKNSL